MKGLGKGKKYSPGDQYQDGLTMRESTANDTPLRGDTGQAKGQRPTPKHETLKDDQGRGSFKMKH